MGMKTSGKGGFLLTIITLMIAGTLITAGCSGGGGGGTAGVTGGSTGDTGGTTAAKATLSGQLLSSSSSSGSSLFKRKMGKVAAATSSLPVSGATVLCFDTDSVSTAAAGTATTDSSGVWSVEVDAGTYVCFGIYIDIASLTIKTARLDDVAAAAGQTTTVDTATVESDTTSPSIASVLSDNVADTSLSDGDPDPLYEITDVLPTQAIAVIFSEAMNITAMQPGTGVVLKDSSGATVETTVAFNGTGTEFRYTPSSPLTSGTTYTLYITNRAKDLSNNGINDPDSDGYVALARITVAAQVDPFSYLSSSPKDGDTGVSVYKDLTVAFNRSVDFVSFKENTTISPAVSGRLEPSGDGVTFFHSAPLAAGTQYTVTIGANVADLAGNKLGTAKTITFDTGAGVSASTVEGFVPGGGTTEDLLAIVAGITKAELALDNQDLATFASYFAPTFTMTEQECYFDPNARTDASGNSIGEEVCTTSTIKLADFLEQMKKDLIEQRNMAKGFGEVQRVMLTKVTADPASAPKMSVEHFYSDFDVDRNLASTGKDLYVGWPNRREGIDFVNSEIEVPDPWSPEGKRREFVTYRIDQNRDLDANLPGFCKDATTGRPGPGEVLVTYHHWNDQTDRDETLTQICPVIDGDADATNSWASNDEVYPTSWTGPRNVWEDNDGSCSQPTSTMNCQNDDGLIRLKSNGMAFRYYETEDPNTHSRIIYQQDITSDLAAAGGLNVVAAMQVAAANGWDIEGVDNDGDSQIIVFDPNQNPSVGCTNCMIERRVNEDWPNGMDDDGDGLVDEDNDGMGSNPWPQDMDDDPATTAVENDTTNDPMPHSDWNLPNKSTVISNDEFWAQTFLVKDSTLAASGATQWTGVENNVNNVYYEIQGPKGWPYPYAAGLDGIPWSGDEFDQHSGSGTSLDGHLFAWADVSYLGRVYFRNDTKSTSEYISEFGAYVDLTAAGIVNANGQILNNTGSVSSNPTDPSTRNRVSGSSSSSPNCDNDEWDNAIYKWDGSGHLKNCYGNTIDWQYVRPRMDSIDYNADGDWNVNSTDSSIKLQRVPHDRTTGGVMSTADYLALGWETWRVSYDYQLISDPTIVWDIEADWAQMEGDDDGDGLFNEEGLFSDYFYPLDCYKNKDNSSLDASLKCSDATLPGKPRAAYTSEGTDGGTFDPTKLPDPDGDGANKFDISDGVDNDFDNQVDEVELWDDDGDGDKDEDPVGDPNDLNGNGNTTEPYDDDGDGRKDEDPVSYERDRLNDHSQWSRVYQSTTDAVVDTFYLNINTVLSVVDIVIDATGTKATAIVDLTETETWVPHNPWGEDFNRDGEPDDVNTWKETMVFNIEKFSTKWLMTSIQSANSIQEANQVAYDPTKQFGGNIARIEMISPVGDPMSGPAINQTTTPTFEWDDSGVSATIGSYLIHIEEITSDMVTSGGKPTTVMMLLLDPSAVSKDSITNVRSFALTSPLATGVTDITTAVINAMQADPYFPFTTALTALEDGKAYAWGILAFSQSPAELQTAFSDGKPEPIADSFEPMMFATTNLPSYFTNSTFGGGSSTSTTVQKAKIGGVEYNTIPSDIAPSFYDRPSSTNSRHSMPSSLDPRSRR